ncbi:MAG TPA: YdeI/OmpD-associated family protein, partial [Puia sp.]|nr:YdeI/OmpD-associated family protein [Puia sp.]
TSNMGIQFFPNQQGLRRWFEKNHQKKEELYLGFYKTKSGKASVTWPQSVDEALCFGWIDGVRKSINEISYYIRFTPRKPGSIWSKINIKKIEDLKKKGLLKTAGIEAFSKRTEKKSGVYSYENEAMKLSKEYEKKLKANKAAWKYFELEAPWYKKVVIRWIMVASQEITREKRLQELIADSANGFRIKRLRYGSKKS